MTPEELEKWKARNAQWREKRMEEVRAEPRYVPPKDEEMGLTAKQAYDRQWRKDHPNYMREWRAKNPEKARAIASRARMRRKERIARGELSGRRHCPGCHCEGRKGA